MKIDRISRSNDRRLKKLVLRHGSTGLTNAYILANHMGLSPRQFTEKCIDWNLHVNRASLLTAGYEDYLKDPLAEEIAAEIIDKLTPDPEVRWYKESRDKDQGFMSSKDYKNKYDNETNIRTGESRGKSAARQMKGGGRSWRNLLDWWWRYLQTIFKGSDIEQYEIKLVKKEGKNK
jgi:hypothetical protein